MSQWTQVDGTPCAREPCPATIWVLYIDRWSTNIYDLILLVFSRLFPQATSPGLLQSFSSQAVHNTTSWICLPARQLQITTPQISHCAAISEMTEKSKMQQTAADIHHDETATPGGEIHLAEHVSYGSTGLKGLFGSPYVFGAAFLASLGGASFGYDQGVMSIINVMPQFHQAQPRTESAFGKSFMTAMLQLGSFFGCLFFPYLADRFSRKRALIVVVIIFNIGSIMQTVAKDYGTLVAGRAIGGVGVGTLALVSISESVLDVLYDSDSCQIGCSVVHIGNCSSQSSWHTTRA